LWRTLAAGSTDGRWAAVLLLAIAWGVYHPALNRVFAADQLWYLAELHGDRSLVAGLAHLDYAATRQYWKGDELLFRPLLFGWLAIAHSLFGYHYVWWNAANLAFHAAVAWALFGLLKTIGPPSLALPAAALFLVLEPSMELVVWNHLGGYLLACLFFAIGARAFVLVMRQPDRWSPYLVYSIAFTAAALSYEAMVPTALAGALLLIGIVRRRAELRASKAAALLAPILIYGSLYAVHISRVERLAFVDRADKQSLFAAGNVANTFRSVHESITDWIRELTMPTALSLRSSAYSRFSENFTLSFSEPHQALNALVAALCLCLLAATVSRRRLRETAPIVVLALSAITAYVFIIGFGRSADEVVGVTYYTYVFALLAGIAIYASVDLGPPRGWKTWTAAALTWAFAAIHAAGTVATAKEVERSNRYASLYLTRIIRFVEAHRSEPGFSFAIDPHAELVDPAIALIEGYPNRPGPGSHGPHVTEILFAPFYDRDNPKYRLNAAAELSPSH
jgi:hypothetical protein